MVWIFRILLEIWEFYQLFFFNPSTWITGEKEQEDRMGCCSGRCTLAFICGMQLVSVEIIIIININPAWQWLKGRISQGVGVQQSMRHDRE